MSALFAISSPVNSVARLWFDKQLPELERGCGRYVRRLPHREREEAVAEMLACIFNYALKAERRGVLHRLTPFTMVSFMGRAYCAGRKLTGCSPRDVLSFAVQRRHHFRVLSFEDSIPDDTDGWDHGIRLSDALPDRKADRPDENARRNIDYPFMLKRGRASRKVRQVFRFLVETLGEGRGKDLARELRVSAPRICQLKNQLGGILALHGYGPRRSLRIKLTGRRRSTPYGHRLRAIPLNAGTSPGQDREREPRAMRPVPLQPV